MSADYQKTVGNLPLVGIGALRDLIGNRKRKVQILNNMDGVLEAGEMLVVLGPPGSGCTTMLKTIAGEMNGIYLDESSSLNYRGQFSLSYLRYRIDFDQVSLRSKFTVNSEAKLSTLLRSTFISPILLSVKHYLSLLKLEPLESLLEASRRRNTPSTCEMSSCLSLAFPTL